MFQGQKHHHHHQQQQQSKHKVYFCVLTYGPGIGLLEKVCIGSIVPEMSCWVLLILSGFITLSGPCHFFFKMTIKVKKLSLR
jgi:hypothetical protein